MSGTMPRRQPEGSSSPSLPPVTASATWGAEAGSLAQAAAPSSSASSLSSLSAGATAQLPHALPLAAWSVAQVADWVGGIGFPHLRDTFVRQHITGLVLGELTYATLKSELGIEKVGDRAKILHAIKQQLSLPPSSATGGSPFFASAGSTPPTRSHVPGSSISAPGSPSLGALGARHRMTPGMAETAPVPTRQRANTTGRMEGSGVGSISNSTGAGYSISGGGTPSAPVSRPASRPYLTPVLTAAKSPSHVTRSPSSRSALVEFQSQERLAQPASWETPPYVRGLNRKASDRSLADPEPRTPITPKSGHSFHLPRSTSIKAASLSALAGGPPPDPPAAMIPPNELLTSPVLSRDSMDSDIMNLEHVRARCIRIYAGQDFESSHIIDVVDKPTPDAILRKVFQKMSLDDSERPELFAVYFRDSADNLVELGADEFMRVCRTKDHPLRGAMYLQRRREAMPSVRKKVPLPLVAGVQPVHKAVRAPDLPMAVLTSRKDSMTSPAARRISRRQSRRTKTTSVFGDRPNDEDIVARLDKYFPRLRSAANSPAAASGLLGGEGTARDGAAKLKSIVAEAVKNKRMSRTSNRLSIRRSVFTPLAPGALSTSASPVHRTRLPDAEPGQDGGDFVSGLLAMMESMSFDKSKVLEAPGPSFPLGAPAPAPSQTVSASATPSGLGEASANPTVDPAPTPRTIRWEQGPLIGQGAFGKVFHGLNLDTGEIMAVKQVSLGMSRNEEQRRKMEEALKRELGLLRDLDHENIVCYLGSEITEEQLNVFLEYVSGGSVASCLSNCGAFAEELARLLTYQILQGLAYLHARGIIHRDIKSGNVLIDNEGVAKISDFGASKKLDALAYQNISRISMQGSIYWMAPEVARSTKGYSAKVDIWSLGCLILEMLTGKQPWANVQGNIIYLLGKGTSPPIPDHLSPLAKEFLGLCFTIDPERRPTAHALLRHPYVDINAIEFDFESWCFEARSRMEAEEEDDDDDDDDLDDDDDAEEEDAYADEDDDEDEEGDSDDERGYDLSDQEEMAKELQVEEYPGEHPAPGHAQMLRAQALLRLQRGGRHDSSYHAPPGLLGHVVKSAKEGRDGEACRPGGTPFRDALQRALLDWYEVHQRTLPWRLGLDRQAEGSDRAGTQVALARQRERLHGPNAPPPPPGQRAYEVWVSEIMLQQTKVSTVIAYYERWMSLWPTIHDLARATLEEVHQVWSGLGYYSRATRLLESAKHVVQELDGILPATPAELIRQVGGVGPYTAGAIASIAWGTPAPLVDGNVVRVLARLRAWGGDPTSRESNAFFWATAEELLEREHPGHWNQALMDLGATICTPTAPSCRQCPIRDFCRAYAEERVHAAHAASMLQGWKRKARPFATADAGDAEEHDGEVVMRLEDAPAANDLMESEAGSPCAACIVDLEDFAVTRYPVKVAKKAARNEECTVCIVELLSAGDSRFLVFQNPAKGLLANLFDFPMVQVPGDVEAYISAFLAPRSMPLFPGTGAAGAGEVELKRTDLGSVTHLFSHIKRVMRVRHVQVCGVSEGEVRFDVAPQDADADAVDDEQGIRPQAIRWMSQEDLEEEQAAVPKTLRKAFALLLAHRTGTKRKGRTATSNLPSSSASSASAPVTPTTKGTGNGKRATPTPGWQPSILAFMQRRPPAPESR